MLPIGIDISKASFDVAFLDDDKYQNKKFKNDLKGDLNKTLFGPKSEAFEALQYLVTRLEQLGKMRSGENNRLQASLNKATSKSIKTMLRAIDKQAQLVEDEIKTLVDNDKQLKHQVKLLLSIDGIGNKTAWAIIAYMGAISLFDNAKQVASFAGLNPKNNTIRNWH
jgi:transposase